MGTVSQTQQLQVKLNRLQAQKAALENKIKAKKIGSRKARTRNLIQLGGLINMVALPNLCGINDGDDLQLDIEASDKAAVLLGMLVHLENSLPPTLSDQLISSFKQKGIRMIKNQAANKTRV
jgi:Conjugal transfer protein TraD